MTPCSVVAESRWCAALSGLTLRARALTGSRSVLEAIGLVGSLIILLVHRTLIVLDTFAVSAVRLGYFVVCKLLFATAAEEFESAVRTILTLATLEWPVVGEHVLLLGPVSIVSLELAITPDARSLQSLCALAQIPLLARALALALREHISRVSRLIRLTRLGDIRASRGDSLDLKATHAHSSLQRAWSSPALRSSFSSPSSFATPCAT